MSLRGPSKRPWLEIRRSELEATYLRHQMRMLNRSLGGGLSVTWDHIEKNDFYCDLRAQIQTEALWPAYELMYPRDEKTVTKDILEIVGLKGIAALWCDVGRPKGKALFIPARHCAVEVLRDYMVRQGFYTSIIKPPAATGYVYWDNLRGLRFAKTMIEIVHPTMRGKLQTFIDKYEPSKPPKKPRIYAG